MDLNRAATFVQVVEKGSFTAAALALRLPTSSVSRSVARLEEDLGVKLLLRTTRSLSLTDAGRAYFERTRNALAGLEEAGALAMDAAREPNGVVRLAVPPDFGTFIAASLGRFVRLYPRIHVDVTFSARAADVLVSEVDLAIVGGRALDDSLIARKLGSAPLELYAASGYLRRRGRPRQVGDLADHDCVLLHGDRGTARWTLTGPDGEVAVDVKGPVSGDQLMFVFESTLDGLGIALLPAILCQAELKKGRLARVLPAWSAENATLSLVYSSRHLPHRVALLRDHLVESMAHHECISQRGAPPKRALAAVAPATD